MNCESFRECWFFLSGNESDWMSGRKTDKTARKKFVNYLIEHGYQLMYDLVGFTSEIIEKET